MSEIVLAPSYTITANLSTLIVQRGQSITVTLTVTSVGGYTGTVTPSCGVLPATYMNCSYSPASVSVPPNGAATTTLTITTSQPKTGFVQPGPSLKPSFDGSQLAWAMPMPLLGLAAFRRKRRNTRIALKVCGIALAALAGLATLSGCAGSSAVDATTPPGTYTLVVSLNGTGGVSNTLNLTVVVQ